MIEKDVKYKLIYTSDIDFNTNIKIVRKIKEGSPEIEIPFLYESLDRENRDNFNSYIYIKESRFHEIYNELVRNNIDITFTDLGVVDGEGVYRLIGDCESIIKDKVDIEKTYKVLSGEYKNIHVSIEEIEDDTVIGVFEVLDKKRRIKLNVSNIKKIDKVFSINEDDKFKNYVQIAQEEDNKRVVVVDGNYVLHRSMVEYKNIYQKTKDIPVGGAFGFYFTLLSIKELFCEYEVFVIFGRKTFKNDMYESIWKFNIDWVRRFIAALGFYVVNTDKSGCGAILKVTKALEDTYRETIIYSNDIRLYSMISDSIKLYKSKETSRGYSILLDNKKACGVLEVESINKVNWAVALRGWEGNTEIIPIKEFYNDKKNLGKLKKYELLSLINKAKSKKEFMEEAAKNEKYEEFINNQFEKNLKILEIEDIESVKVAKGEFDIDKMVKLWEEIGFNREKEYINKVNRIFRGVW